MEKIAPKEKNLTVGRMVAENYKKAAIFKQYGIDFCCGGGISLEEACKLKNVDINEIQNILKEIDEEYKLTTDEYTLVDFVEDLKKRGWSFVGPTTICAFMQSMGMVNDHLPGCELHTVVAAERAALVRPVPHVDTTATP